MYILHVHDSSLGVCFANISRIALFFCGPRVKVKVVAGGSLSPHSHRGGGSCLGIGLDRVLVFGFSGVMISIKSIDVFIGHGCSVGVCFAKRLQIYRIGKRHFSIFFPRSAVSGRSVGLVLVFDATRREMALRSGS